MNIRNKTPRPTNARDEKSVATKPKSNDTWHTVVKASVGFLLLIVVASIAFSTYMVMAGTGDSIAPKVMIAPQAAFAGVVLIKRFTKN